MHIEIVNKEGEIVTDFELETNPFKVGETITVNVSNHDGEYWDIKELNGVYLIDKIEHNLRKDYRNKKVYTTFCVIVEVTKIT